MKKITILCALMLCGAQAANADIYNGSCGATAAACSWTLNTDNGTMTISGNGAMKNWSRNPWYDLSSSFTSVVISGVTSIGNYAFQSCGALAQVTIPSNVISIGIAAFSGCTNLTKIIALNPTPVPIGANVFEYVPRNIPLYVPSGSVDAYRATPVWQEFQVTPIPEVTFNSQGGTAVVPQILAPDANAKAVKPADPAKIGGYDFCGWYTNTDYTTEWDFNNVVTGGITLYAKWMLDKITVTYKCVGVGCNPDFRDNPRSVEVPRSP